MSEAAPAPLENMGQPLPRYDGRAKVTGAARYGSDQPVNNPTFAFLVTSAIAKGRITAFEDTAARAVPGVLEIYTYKNRPKLNPIKRFTDGGQGLTAVCAMQDDQIHFEGEIVALIVAETFEAAREAHNRVIVRYQREAPAATFDSPGITNELTHEVVKSKEDPKLGDAATALKNSEVVVDAVYETPIQHHNAIEMFSTTAVWEGDELTVYEPSQLVYALRQGLSVQLGVPPEKIRAVSPYIGGGFGAKGAMTQRSALVAAAARALNRPVKLVLTRGQCFTLSGHRQETRHRVRLGADAQGHLTGYHHDIWEVTSRTDAYCNGGVENAAALYKFPTVMSTGHLLRADRNPPTFMRSPPEVPVMFALESAMDELAIKLAMDPVTLRRLNETDKNMVTGKPYTSRSLMACYDQASREFGWSKRDPKVGSMRDGDWLIGWGCATTIYPSASNSCVVKVRYDADGSAYLQTAGHDVGTGMYTIFQQEVGLRLGITPERVRVEMGDTRFPPGPLAGGSTGSASGCCAIMVACEKILSRLNIPVTADTNARTTAFEKIKVGSVEELGDYAPPGGRTGSTVAAYQGTPDIAGGVKGDKTRFAFGAEFVEVRINLRTREIRCPRVVGAFAAGRILNTRTAHSQLMGGLIWGIASALHEATEIDVREARYVNDNLADYLIPVNADIGEVKVIMVPEVDTEVNAAGVKGIGELGNVGTSAAIANAVYHATGKRFRKLPIRIDELIA